MSAYPFCRRRAIEIPDVAKFTFPTGLSKIMTVAITGAALRDGPQNCRHTLDIRDRYYDGGSGRQFWFQQDLVVEQCTGKHLVPVTGAILRAAYPTNHVEDIEGTITLTRKGVAMPDLVTLLVRELPPVLTAKRIDIYHSANRDYRGDIYHPDKSFAYRNSFLWS